MPVYKTEKNGTWYAMVRYKDWKGERKQKCQRGFATKREAQEWERQFQLQKQANMDMTLESFCKLYEADVRPRLKENTWLTKESIIQSKILRKALFKAKFFLIWGREKCLRSRQKM